MERYPIMKHTGVAIAAMKDYSAVLGRMESHARIFQTTYVHMSERVQKETFSMLGKIREINSVLQLFGTGYVIGSKIASAAWNMAELNAKLDDGKRSIQGLSVAYGTSAGAMIDSLQTAADGTVSKFAALDIANKGFQAGLNPEQIKVFTEAAENLGDKVGLDAATAFDKIVEAVNNGDTEMLKHFGVVADLSGEYAKYGNNLTDAEKKAINLKVVSAALGDAMSNMGAKVDTPSDQVARLNVKMESIQITLGNAVVFLVDKFIKFGEWLGETAAKIVIAFENAVNAIIEFPRRAYDAGVTLVKEFIAGIKSKAEESYNAVFSDI